MLDFIKLLCFLSPVPDEVASLQFDEISDRAVKVVWTPPKQSNGILTGYRLKYHVKDFVNTMREEMLSANVTSIKIEKLEVRLGLQKDFNLQNHQ